MSELRQAQQGSQENKRERLEQQASMREVPKQETRPLGSGTYCKGSQLQQWQEFLRPHRTVHIDPKWEIALVDRIGHTGHIGHIDLEYQSDLGFAGRIDHIDRTQGNQERQAFPEHQEHLPPSWHVFS